MAADTAATQKHHVSTTLNFFKPNEDGSPPSPAYLAKPETFERPPATRHVTIQDVTGDEDVYTLDSHGFQYVTSPSAEKDFNNTEQIKEIYYKEIDTLLKELTGATRTFVFDHTVRKPNPDQKHAHIVSHDEENTKKSSIPPTHSVHVDQTYEAALSRVAFHLPDEAETLLKGRVQLINLWRPIKTVRRDPLAVCDSQSVLEDDLVPIEVIYPHGNRTGATMAVRHRDSHQWYYKHLQTPDEVLVFKCFDNRAGAQSPEQYKGRAKRVPHSAFSIPGTEGEVARESIEVRALVFCNTDI